MNESNNNHKSISIRSVASWLFFVAFSVFIMAIVGAITRLTESGLSIMEWAPIKGTLPPLSQAEWERVFDLYKTIPEYQWDNPDMTLAEFKTIVWWERLHRLLGRLIGLFFAVPMVIFWIKGMVPGWLRKHLVFALLLGGLQGFMGWFMVASGFSDRTDVSQYRLAMHLGLALVIFAYLIWLGLCVWHEQKSHLRLSTIGQQLSLIILALVAITVISGAFVAGLNAGVIYNTFPLMGGDLIPFDYRTDRSLVADMFENPAAVQWNHRLMATFTTISVTISTLIVFFSDKQPNLPSHWRNLVVWVWFQAALGVLTLLLVVPIWAGALHQAGALVLLALGFRCLFFENYPNLAIRES